MEVGLVVVNEAPDLAADFDVWVAARSVALTRFAYLVTGNRHEGEEALQSALTSAYAKWSRVRRADDAAAYVRRMVVNAHVSWWRSFRRRETTEPPSPLALTRWRVAGNWLGPLTRTQSLSRKRRALAG